MYISDALDIRDPVLVFDHIMGEIELEKYLSPADVSSAGRPGYNQIDMLKTILFGFMENGYTSLRQLEENCRVNIRYMYLMNYECPSYHTFGNVISSLSDNIEDIFLEINKKVFEIMNTDLNHIYIDGTKFEANANRYSWVWKKATEKSRYRLYRKITDTIEEMNPGLSSYGLKIESNTEYTPESLDEIISAYVKCTLFDPENAVHGRGHRKSTEQRFYEKLVQYRTKLASYIEKISICGEGRNSYSKTDNDATFMHIKRDHMRNDKLLPAYNIQIGVADEFIAAVDVQQYRNDMDCFVPLMEKFHNSYGFYPEYPVADAGYGSYNNYLYCQEHGMKKYMKFPMYKKETQERKYRDDPFRAENFRTDESGTLICPNGKKMLFSHRTAVKGNLYGRQNEIYVCEDCSGCPFAETCKRGSSNRTIRVNEELTALHREVLENLESIHGAYLRMNRSIQAEGTFGIIKQDRMYRRTVRRGLKKVKLEIYLVSIGYNLHKYYKKQLQLRNEMNAA